MSRTTQRVDTRLDEISRSDEELRKHLKNFERIPDDELCNVTIGTFLKYLRYTEGVWKLRTGGIVKFNGYPQYFCISFRYSNGKWKPHNINLSKDVIFFRAKKLEYDEKEIKILLDSLKCGMLRLIKSEDLQKLTTIYNAVREKNKTNDSMPKLSFMDYDIQISDSGDDSDDICNRDRTQTIVKLIGCDNSSDDSSDDSSDYDTSD